VSAYDDAAPPKVLAVIVAREGRLPAGAVETAAEAHDALVVGTGASDAAAALIEVRRVWWFETTGGFRPAALAAQLAPLLGAVTLTLMPASPDGRDLAPRVAATLDRPLVAGAIRAEVLDRTSSAGVRGVRATVSRLDDRVLVPLEVEGPAVATLVPGSRAVAADTGQPEVEPLGNLPQENTDRGSIAEAVAADPNVVAELEPDLHTMDLADASRVIAGGAGLATGVGDREATAVFTLLGEVAAALGGSAGATRVATDAGWTEYTRQIGTTGVTIDPDLYVAFGISGATQHVAGLGNPRHVVSVNTDPSAPMTATADLGVITDARALLVELAIRAGLEVPAELAATEVSGA
jgi:electron transfer flavoprotein alpha subunit